MRWSITCLIRGHRYNPWQRKRLHENIMRHKRICQMCAHTQEDWTME
jgi:hypothetical protein